LKPRRSVILSIGIIAAAAALAIPGTTKAAETAPLAVEAFSQLPFLGSALLSPDGTRIAARVYIDSTQRIGI
jgi:hypothetical protein